VEFPVVLQRLRELGFDGVELGAFPPHPNPGKPGDGEGEWPGTLATRGERDQLKAQMESMGLRFSGIAANLWGERLVNTDDSSAYVAEFRKNCEFAQDLGIEGVRVDTVQPPLIHKDVEYDVALHRVWRTWRECSKIAAGHGLYVTWEFEPGFAFNKPSDILRIHDAVDQPNFGLMYDTCHGEMVAVKGARQEGEKEVFPSQIEFLKLLHGRINHIHFIDSDGTCHKDANGEDETSAHPPFGRGYLDFDQIVPALLEAARPVHDWWTIDLCFWPDAWSATADCKAAVDRLVEKYG
jgi:sugar phosphate isomerase/epimerase